MTEPTPDPKPRRSRRMVVWMVAVPIVILLLALAGANWRFFHLAYAKHLMGSDDPEKQVEGLARVITAHMRQGMSKSEVEHLVRPLALKRVEHPMIIAPFEAYDVYIDFPPGSDQLAGVTFMFDETGLTGAQRFRDGSPIAPEYELGK